MPTSASFRSTKKHVFRKRALHKNIPPPRGCKSWLSRCLLVSPIPARLRQRGQEYRITVPKRHLESGLAVVPNRKRTEQQFRCCYSGNVDSTVNVIAAVWGGGLAEEPRGASVHAYPPRLCKQERPIFKFADRSASSTGVCIALV